jgi:hypothetical protein
MLSPPVTTSAELYHVYRTWDPHAAALTPQFSSIEPLFIRERGLSAAKLKRKCDEARTGLTRHHVKSPGYNERRALPHLSHLGPPRRCIE